MSFLLLRGKTYHCTDCGLALTIEYEGGPQFTQVGDMSVIHQQILNKQYMPSTYNPEKEGYYFHTEALCGDCLPSHINNHVVVYKIDDVTLFDEDYYTTGNIPDTVISVLEKAEVKYAKKFDTNYCKKLHPEYYGKTIGQFELIKPALVEEYLTLARNSIIRDFKNYLFGSNNFQDVIEAELKKLYDGKKQCYLQIKFGETENLNPYLCYDLTVRTQVEPYTEYELYEGPYAIPKDKIRTFLKKGWFDQLFKKERRSVVIEEIRKNIVGL